MHKRYSEAKTGATRAPAHCVFPGIELRPFWYRSAAAAPHLEPSTRSEGYLLQMPPSNQRHARRVTQKHPRRGCCITLMASRACLLHGLPLSKRLQRKADKEDGQSGERNSEHDKPSI
jgi:hypothetical protein